MPTTEQALGDMSRPEERNLIYKWELFKALSYSYIPALLFSLPPNIVTKNTRPAIPQDMLDCLLLTLPAWETTGSVRHPSVPQFPCTYKLIIGSI